MVERIEFQTTDDGAPEKVLESWQPTSIALSTVGDGERKSWRVRIDGGGLGVVGR